MNSGDVGTAVVFRHLLLVGAVTSGTALGLVFYPTAYLCAALFVLPGFPVLFAGLALLAGESAVRSARLGVRIGFSSLAALVAISVAHLAGCLLVAICLGMTPGIRESATTWFAAARRRVADEFDFS